MMTRLLVSARNAAEAQLAQLSGVDLIDLKEPSAGALAAVSADVWQHVAQKVSPNMPLSVALGELPEADALPLELLPQRMNYAKVGLAQCASLPDLAERYTRFWRRVPRSMARVAVCYADWQRAGAPSPAQVFSLAQAVGCCALLVDTYIKDGRGLLHWWTLDELSAVLTEARRADWLTVVGGSLSAESIAQLLPLSVDVVAVRGAACVGDRTGTLDAGRMRELVKLLRASDDAKSTQFHKQKSTASCPANFS